jgi:chemotaxis protein MotB
MSDTPAPIIIKRIKKAAHAHHGGSWKVAYADFVTAMMAFFLLLWLLNVTTPEQKKGIADYFTPTIGIKDSKGIGFKGGQSPNPKGTSVSNLMTPGIVVGQVQQGPVSKKPSDAKDPDPNEESTSSGEEAKKGSENNDDSADKQDSETFKLAENDIRQALEADPDIKEYKNNVQFEQTNEGMKINMIDDPKKEMFVAGGATLTAAGKKVLDSMANIIVKTPNQLTISGHTDASGPTSNPRYTNWELSADRANATRRALVTTQVEPERVVKVSGLADREPLMPDDPANARNRRVTITLIRGSYFRDPRSQVTNSGRPILSVPDAKIKNPNPIAPSTPEPVKPAGPSIFDNSSE